MNVAVRAKQKLRASEKMKGFSSDCWQREGMGRNPKSNLLVLGVDISDFMMSCM